MKSIADVLRQILGRQGLWLVVAIVAVLIPFVTTAVELSKEFGRYQLGTIAFAVITLIWLGTMAVALRTKPTDPPKPAARIPENGAGTKTQASQGARAKK